MKLLPFQKLGLILSKTQKIVQWIKKNPAHVIGHAVFLIVFLTLHGERIINNFKSEGIEISSQNYQTIDGHTLNFPMDKKNTILLFWATWCTPCKIEMDRLKRSVEDGAIKGDSIYLLNPFEERSAMDIHLKKYPYPFIFLLDENQTVSRTLKITQTPTMLFLNGNKILRMSSGISLTGIYQAESFLNKN